MFIFAISLSNDLKMQRERHTGYQHHPEMLLTTLETCPLEFKTCLVLKAKEDHPDWDQSKVQKAASVCYGSC